MSLQIFYTILIQGKENETHWLLHFQETLLLTLSWEPLRDFSVHVNTHTLKL